MYTFLNITEQQAIRIFIPQCNISISVIFCKTIEVNMLNTRPNAHMYAYPKSAFLEASELKYDNIPPINRG